MNKLCKRDFDVQNVFSFYHKRGVQTDNFHFTPVSECDVGKLLKNLSVSKSTGLDMISAKFVKDGSSIIKFCSPLTYIINLSLRLSIVPAGFKTARVVPLYKKGSRNVEGNYRPVSILPIVSKIMERIAFNQLQEYLDTNNLIYNFQSGFRKGHSTDSALIHLTDSIRLNMDNGLYTWGCTHRSSKTV